MTVLAATILCDRKAPSQMVAVPAVAKLRGVDTYYVNIESNLGFKERYGLYGPLLDFVNDKPNIDIEWWYRSGWFGSKPTFDQDQKRLTYIITARNMAIDYAMCNNFEWLLFIDADVQPAPDGLEILLASGKHLCGGLVPGRGVHSRMKYIFNAQETRDDYIKCTHGTCGYMLIHRDIFSVLRFRWGPHIHNRGVLLSEDPAYCADAIQVLNLTDGFYIYNKAIGNHLDDPIKPLQQSEVAQY